AAHEKPVWGFHVLSVEGDTVGDAQFETDRARFLGRGRTAADPAAMSDYRALSGTSGSVLDPAFAIRRTVRILPGQTARLTFSTGIGETRDRAIELADKYHETAIFARAAELAWTQSQVQLRHLNVSISEAHRFQKLAGRILYLDPSLRPRSHKLAQNARTQSGLWAFGISGDLPILLTKISDEKDLPMIRELLRAHEYLRLKGLSIDLVILNERAPSYLQSLQDDLQAQIRMSGSQALLDRSGGVFLRRTDLMSREEVTLLQTVARVTLDADRGTLEEQLKHRSVFPEMPADFSTGLLSKVPLVRAVAGASAITSVEKVTPEPLPSASTNLEFYNGIGGFSAGAREYIIQLKDSQWTPVPWSNVIANKLECGTVVTEAGSGYTWSANSRENRLTPWSNDPVSDPTGEALYIRDEETGEFWTPTPLPIRGPEPYLIAHGQGYSRFEYSTRGIESTLLIFVPEDGEAKISRLTLKNKGDQKRKLSVSSYIEWVLGTFRSTGAPFAITEFDDESGAVFARNPYNNEFADRVAFAAFSEKDSSFTCSRSEFIGRNGNLANPAALRREKLSGAEGAGLDPCAAFQATIELEPGESREVIVLLGECATASEARAQVKRFIEPSEVKRAFDRVVGEWETTLGTFELKTPDPAMNALVNRWLLYQSVACRLWARSGFYQSGGAFGFRDQLQDVMALVYSHPELAREHILRAAERQFVEGDVQHWWHPPTGRGVRTHFSDDLLWLPFVTTYYIHATGDRSILEAVVPFIEAPVLQPGQEDSYTHPTISQQKASLFEHCARTIDRSLKVGAHGLPLMGAGDWNDGMNRVGHEGKGESVWVAWFLYTVIEKFLPLCREAGEAFAHRTEAYENHLVHLKNAVETEAWDGKWYRRAFFDDGTPLGTHEADECRIDSIAQTWSVISGAGNPERAKQAMDSVDEHLIKHDQGIIRLFTPPFDKTPLDPGYIKGYVPSVRENGG
ncbi:MAG: hypothetical protein EOP09_03325, partial [Proteobacteria bacterium]